MEHLVDPDAFDAFEAAGWEQRAGGYDDFVGGVTRRLADPLLDAAGATPGARVLDIATGPGHVAGCAAARGATAVGTDLAEAMLARARDLYPGVEFTRADAQSLPFEDASFDAVVGNFAILHFGRPERAVAEFARVLAPGGRLALTTWDVPARSRLLGVFFDAVASAGVAPPEDLPAGPDVFRFADETEFDALLKEQGLEDRHVGTVYFTERVRDAAELWDGLLAGSVRTSALIVSQPADVQARIREELDRLVDEHRSGDGFEIPVSVKLASGRRPDS